jgi:peptide/nickel transport system permease protein
MSDESRPVQMSGYARPAGISLTRLPRRELSMVLAILHRAATVAVQLLAVSIIVFVVLRVIPADPLAMMLPPNATYADAERMRSAFGLDRSIAEQYLIWIEHALRGDFGASIQSRIPVTQLVLTALPMTLELVISVLIVGISVGIALGLLTFWGRGTI